LIGRLHYRTFEETYTGERENTGNYIAPLVAQMVKNLPAMLEKEKTVWKSKGRLKQRALGGEGEGAKRWCGGHSGKEAAHGQASGAWAPHRVKFAGIK